TAGLNEAERGQMLQRLNELPPYRFIESDTWTIFGFTLPYNFNFNLRSQRARAEILNAYARHSLSGLLEKAFSEQPLSRPEMAALVLKLGNKWGRIVRVKHIDATLNNWERLDPTFVAQWLHRNRELKI